MEFLGPCDSTSLYLKTAGELNSWVNNTRFFDSMPPEKYSFFLNGKKVKKQTVWQVYD